MELLRRPVPWLVPVTGAALAVAVVAAVAVTHVADPLQRWGGVALGAVLVAVATWRLTRWAGRRRLEREVLDRPADAVTTFRGHPYRGALRRAGHRVTPPVSGVMAAVVVGASLAIAATVAPLAMARPLWIEIEVVLAIWWVLLSVSLTVLLHRGARIARDL